MKVLYTRVSDYRNKHYAIKTSIAFDGAKKVVIKEALYPEGLAHIRNIHANGELIREAYPNIKIGETWIEDEKLYGEFIDGKLLSDYYSDCLKDNDKDGFLKLLDQHLNYLFIEDNLCKFEPSRGFSEWFGSGGSEFAGQSALRIVDMDATDGNIIFENGDMAKPCFIDCEWCFNFPVPVSLVKYHIIDLLFNLPYTHSLFGDRESIFSRHLSEQDIVNCGNARSHFFDRVHGLKGVDPSVPERNKQIVKIKDIYDHYAQSDISLDEERNRKEAEKAAAISEKDAIIVKKEAEFVSEISHRDEVIAEKNSLISRKDEVISEREAEIEEKSAVMIHMYDKLLRSRRLSRNRKHRIAQLKLQRASLKRQRARLKKKEKRLNRILRSRTWRYGRKLARAARKVLPKKAGRTKFVRNLIRPFRKKSAKTEQPFRKYEKIFFEANERPKVTIIVPVHNQFAYTYNCLKSIHDTCGGLNYEVIIADDASSDFTRKANKKFINARVVRNDSPLFFLRNCNRAAASARGEYIVFLNNDTVVHEGWLEMMLKLIRSDDGIGIVGSKLLFADGKLQEAGGIVWNDGSAWNYGRRDDADKPEYNYVKEVDYVSGASLMIRRTLWEEIGGFDDRYAPAYYEDTDIAFEVRKRGFKVIYQPASTVTHYEGVSNGSDIAAGLKSYQTTNHEKFMGKWKDTLRKGQGNPVKSIVSARDRTLGKKTVVFIDHYLPSFDKDAGSRSMYEYIKLFQSMGYHVTLIPDNFHAAEYYTDIYQQMGIELVYGPWYNKNNWREWMDKRRDVIDVFFLSRPHVSIKYIDYIKENMRATILYCGQDLHFLREQRQYEITKDPMLPMSIEQWQKIEFELIEKSDCALFPSYEEKEVLQSFNPDYVVETYPVYILPDTERKIFNKSSRNDLMFVGGFNHTPNSDAVFWFVEDIFPQVLKERPEMILHIVGSNAPDRIKALDGKNIKVHGFVSDDELADIYASSRLVVVPLRYGAGIKGKIVEAMGYGVPVVTTPIGAEGFRDADEYLAVEETAEGFADRILTIYDDEVALSRLTVKSYDYLETVFSAKKAQEVIEKAIRYGDRGKKCI
jgi:GT2 family glycosyltransferase/glycosyltransferase involved in cell wall biosynthesis